MMNGTCILKIASRYESLDGSSLNNSAWEVLMKIRVLVLALLVGVTALAQPRRMTPHERVDKLDKQLGLTSDQKAKVLDLFTKEEKEMQPPAAGTKVDREAMKAQINKMHHESQTELKAILTPEQYAKLEQMKSKMPAPPGKKEKKEK
jgi:Spy/CpxP family protein refolding chaperone